MTSNSGRASVAVAAIVLGIAAAATNLILAVRMILGIEMPPSLAPAVASAYQRQPYELLILAGTPLLLAILLLLIDAFTGGPAAAPAPAVEEAAPAVAPHAAALRLLALLQEEGRLIDFLEEDIAPYDDAQVGAAVRTIHSGCRKALHERMQINRIYSEEDGAEVEVPTGFDPSAVRLTGNVHGQPPFRGTLQHGGWRATQVKLPEPSADLDPALLAPAEVEIA
jgi:Domain of unknown function (DUF2760)